jgi:hypothetical protein
MTLRLPLARGRADQDTLNHVPNKLRDLADVVVAGRFEARARTALWNVNATESAAELCKGCPRILRKVFVPHLQVMLIGIQDAHAKRLIARRERLGSEHALLKGVAHAFDETRSV